MQDQLQRLVAEVVALSGAKGILAKNLRRELESHVFEAAQELDDGTRTPDEIAAEVTQRFGKPEEIGKSFEIVHQIPMQNIFKKIAVAGGVLVALGIASIIFVDHQMAHFENALAKRYGAYEAAMAYASDISSKPCKTDGLGVRRAPFGFFYTRCDVTWYHAFGILWQTKGPHLDRGTADNYLMIPNDYAQGDLLREMKRNFAAGMEPRATDVPGESIMLSFDYGPRYVVYPQMKNAFAIGNIEYTYALRQNANTSLVIGNAVAELEVFEPSFFIGLIARRLSEDPTQQPGPWTALYELYDGQLMYDAPGMVDPNVRNVFFNEGELYIDIVDAQGPGSGEGNLLRLKYEDLPQEFVSISEWNTNQWSRSACMHYIPETYEQDGPFKLPYSTACFDNDPLHTYVGSPVPITYPDTSGTSRYGMNIAGAQAIIGVFFGSLHAGLYEQAAEFADAHSDDPADALRQYCEDWHGLCYPVKSVAMVERVQDGTATFGVEFEPEVPYLQDRTITVTVSRGIDGRYRISSDLPTVPQLQ